MKMEWFKRKKKDDTKVNNREFKELFDGKNERTR